jgi:hypothetical protein
MGDAYSIITDPFVHLKYGADPFVQLRRFAQRGDVENVRALLPTLSKLVIRLSSKRVVMFGDAFRLAMWNGWHDVADLMVQAAPWLRIHPTGPFNYYAVDEAACVPCESAAFATWLLHKVESGWPSNRPVPKTPLENAAQEGRVSAVKRLVYAKANMQDRSAISALCDAVVDASGKYDKKLKKKQKKAIGVIAVLLRAKATLRQPDNARYMETPLYLAVTNGQLHVTRVLIRAKADVNEKPFGRRPLEIALNDQRLHYGHGQAIVDLLRNAGAH